MGIQIKSLGLVLSLVMLSACGKEAAEENVAFDPATVVIKSHAQFVLSTDSQSEQASMIAHNRSQNDTQNISVINGSSSSMTLDGSLFVIPTIKNALLDFGYLQLTALSDNDLKVCGTSGKQKCT